MKKMAVRQSICFDRLWPHLYSVSFFHAGYFCPTGSNVDSEVICPIGKHCPTQSVTPVDCAAGTYTDVEGQWECTTCPEGKILTS